MRRQMVTTMYNNHNNQLLVTPNEMFGLYCNDYPLNDPLFLSDLSPLMTHFSCNFAGLHVVACCHDLIVQPQLINSFIFKTDTSVVFAL